VRLGATPLLRARLLAPQIHRRQPDAKTLRDRCRRHTGFISQQNPLAQVDRIGLWHPLLLREAANSTDKQDAFQTQPETALIRHSSVRNWRRVSAGLDVRPEIRLPVAQPATDCAPDRLLSAFCIVYVKRDPV
jgi:hypothetical protein